MKFGLDIKDFKIKSPIFVQFPVISGTKAFGPIKILSFIQNISFMLKES